MLSKFTFNYEYFRMCLTVPVSLPYYCLTLLCSICQFIRALIVRLSYFSSLNIGNITKRIVANVVVHSNRICLLLFRY